MPTPLLKKRDRESSVIPLEKAIAMPLKSTSVEPREEAYSQVSIPMMDGSTRILVYTTRVALDDYDPKARWLDAFRARRAQIEKIASAKYDRGELRPDGTILIDQI